MRGYGPSNRTVGTVTVQIVKVITALDAKHDFVIIVEDALLNHGLLRWPDQRARSVDGRRTKELEIW